MSMMIEVANHPECIWWLNNRTYWWFSEIVEDRYEYDEEAVHKLKISKYICGLLLHTLADENADLAHRMAMYLRTVAQEVVEGQHLIYDDNGEPIPSMSEVGAVFAELVSLLDWWLEKGES